MEWSSAWGTNLQAGCRRKYVIYSVHPVLLWKYFRFF